MGYFAVSMIVQRSFVKEFPHHIHAWAHCDHYAISKGFINNGFDFFHPETYVYNKQFANEDGSSNDSKITAVDFPINNYLVAIAMKILHSDSPAIFRLYTLIVACLGLSYLFLISYHFTKNYILSFTAPIIVVFTPVYLSYQVGFLPSITSLTLLFFSCYYFLKYSKTQKISALLTCVIGLSISALIRTPFIIHLVSLLGFLFIDQIIKKRFNLREWLITLSGFVLPILYFLYNGYLREKYGSIFLSSPVLIEDWNHAKEIIKKAKDTWKNHYFNEFQYYIISLVAVVVVIKFFLSKYFLSKEGKSLLIWFSIGTIGVLAYSFLMIPQFKDHDYYFLDTFYPIIFVLTLYAISGIKFTSYSIKLSMIGMVLLSILIISSSNSTLKGRRSLSPNDLYLNEYIAYLEFPSLIKDNHISKNEKILIIDSYAPNMPFILSNTSGYSLIYRSREDIIKAFDLDFNYISVSKSYFINHLLLDYPDFTKEVKLIGKSDKLLLFKREKNNKTFDILSFLQLEKPIAIFNAKNSNSDNICLNEDGIQNFSNKEFGFTNNYTFDEKKSNYIVHVRGELVDNITPSSMFIFDLYYNDERQLYSSTVLQPTEKNDWIIDFYVYLDKVKVNSKGTFYIYNPNLEELKLKNIQIEIF